MADEDRSELNTQDLIHFLKKTPYFADLSEEQLQELGSLCDLASLEQDEVLFHQGDASDAMYILVEGRLVAYFERVDSTKVVGIVHVGETVGELGGFTSKARSLTVCATHDSTLIVLTRSQIRLFLERFTSADLYLKILETIINRSQSVIKQLGNEKLSQHSVIVPATNQPLSDAFLTSLKAQLDDRHNITLVDREYLDTFASSEPLEQLVSVMKKADVEKKTLVFIIQDIERLKYYIDLYEAVQGKDLFHEVDSIYAFVDVHGEKQLNPYIKILFNENFLPFISKKALIVWHGDCSDLPKNTRDWLEQADFSMHHHVRNRQADIKRLYRFFLDKPNTIVLGGGGTRGWASFGILKALEEHGIAIDAFAGCSAGSIIGSGIAHTLDYKAAVKFMKNIGELSSGIFSLKNLSFPVISINNGKFFTNTLKEIFDDLRIEDLWIYNFSIASDLNSNLEIIQKSGPVWEAVRCSCSLPFVYPPYVKGGNLIVDGGLLNNLPVDRMQDLVGKDGFIIAVNLSDFSSKGDYYFPPIVTFWEGLKARFHFIDENYVYPPFVETMLKALMLGSSIKAIENGNKADLLIEPDVSDVPIVNYPVEKLSELFERGYTAATPLVEDLVVCPATGIISRSIDKS